MSILIGKWKWKHTIATGNGCVSHFGGAYITDDPSTVGYDYEITFLEKGKVILKKGNKDKKHRIINDPNYQGYIIGIDTTFSFNFDRKNKPGITVTYHKKSGYEYLEIYELPEGLTDAECEDRVSIFEKIE